MGAERTVSISSGKGDIKFLELTFNDGINGAALLAVTAVDALGHIDIISGRSSAAVLTFLGFNGNGLGRADGFAELASDAALLASWVSAQGVFATEPRRDGTLFEGIVDGIPSRSVRIRYFEERKCNWSRH